MDRISALQSILDTIKCPTYLEIGVCTGESFIPIRANRKWGVDPAYLLTWRRRLKYAVFSFLRLKVERLFRLTSDDFFVTKRNMLASNGIDVCFVDGLHTSEQSLKDVLNALEYLKPDGAILMHDCNPATEVMAIRATSIDEVSKMGIPGWNGAWSGDVWKAVVRLRSLRDDVDVFVLDCDTGVGVVTKGHSGSRLRYSEGEIEAMDYSFLAAHRKELLDLRPPEYLEEFLRERARKA